MKYALWLAIPLALSLSACKGGEPEDTDVDDTDVEVDDDADNDGYDAGPDCNDAESSVHPGAEELCDGLDNNCNGLIDDEPEHPPAWYHDYDGDGFGDDVNDVAYRCDPGERIAQGGDCDDGNGDIHPGADEVCNNRDDDCNGQVDDGAEGMGTFYDDDDGDGYGDPATGAVQCDSRDVVDNDEDCDDAHDDVHPGANERCDGRDEDCDGQIDDGATDLSMNYADADLDGFGDDATGVLGCEPPQGRVLYGGDCNDADVYLFPGAPELCDDRANDCDTAGSWTSATENGHASTERNGRWTDITGDFDGSVALSQNGTTNVWLCEGTWDSVIQFDNNGVVRGRGHAVMTDGGNNGGMLYALGTLGVYGVDFDGSPTRAIYAPNGLVLNSANFTNITDAAVEAGTAEISDVTISASGTGVLLTGAGGADQSIFRVTVDDVDVPFDVTGQALVETQDLEVTNSGQSTFTGADLVFESPLFASNVDTALSVSATGEVYVNAGEFRDNTAQQPGAGIRVEAATEVTISGSSFSNNHSTFRGGAIDIEVPDADVQITDTTSTDDFASGQSGFLVARIGDAATPAGSLTLSNLTVDSPSGNAGHGQAIEAWADEVSVSAVSIDGGYGSAQTVWLQGSTLTMDDVSVQNSDAGSSGQVMYLTFDTGTITNLNASSNVGELVIAGGAYSLADPVIADNTGGVTVFDAQVVCNASTVGGPDFGIYRNSSWGVFLWSTFPLTSFQSVGCDFGTGADDNAGGTDIDLTYNLAITGSYGDDAYFVCDTTNGCL